MAISSLYLSVLITFFAWISFAGSCQSYYLKPDQGIVGGDLVDSIDDYPFMAAIFDMDENGQREFRCGASFLHDNLIITAARNGLKGVLMFRLHASVH